MKIFLDILAIIYVSLAILGVIGVNCTKKQKLINFSFGLLALGGLGLSGTGLIYFIAKIVIWIINLF